MISMGQLFELSVASRVCRLNQRSKPLCSALAYVTFTEIWGWSITSGRRSESALPENGYVYAF